MLKCLFLVYDANYWRCPYNLLGTYEVNNLGIVIYKRLFIGGR